MDRSAINRALAKAMAYKQCGKEAEAREWARELVRLLECADILQPDDVTEYPPDFLRPGDVGRAHAENPRGMGTRNTARFRHAR